MNTGQQSPGGTQNSQTKEWYKHWWGVIIAILILPVFAIWYVWAKSKLNTTNKWVMTVIIVVLTLIITTSGGSSDKSKETAKTPPTADQPKVEETSEQANQAPIPPPAPKFTFDVPSLIGKNIDEVVAALGKPSTDKEPTKQQLTMGIDSWDKEFTKDGVGLLVSYNPKSKVVSDFFIDGEDKAKLLTLGNLQERSDAYIAEFVKAVTDPNKIMGVKVSKKLPAELDGSVAYNAVAFQISNNEDYGWTNCRFEINGGIISSGYEYKTTSGIKAKDKLVVLFSEFTKDGDRFNFLAQKPEKLFIACDTNGQHRTNYFAIK